MKNEEYLNEALEKIIDEAAKLAAEDIGLEKLPDEDSVVMSEKHNQRMQEIFNAERERLKRKRRMKITRIAAACIAVALIACTAGIAIDNVEAWKTRFLNFVQEFSRPNTHYNAKESGGTVYSDDNVILEYVPMGFELENSLSTNKRVRLKFLGNEQYFLLILGEVDDNLNVDTETANAEKLVIGTCDAVYVTNPNINALNWNDDELSYHLAGDISKEELIKIAENVKVLKNK